MLTSSDNNLNVEVISFILQDNPASILINLKVSEKVFFSRITYHSIPSWEDVWKKCINEDAKKMLLGALVAWDSMRFMALGGEELILCEGLVLDKNMQRLWHYCFLNQFGEWRYRNDFQYRAALLPRVIVKDYSCNNFKQDLTTNFNRRRKERHIITNGGGKDTLVGMLLMNDANILYDVYEGYLPIGGSKELQNMLLKKLRDAMTTKKSKLVQVTVEDNFYDTEDNILLKLGVSVNHYKTDFAVGHTANYPGYFPIIIYHDYSHVWFNIEASADRSMATWNNESINHQWCKTKEYQEISAELYWLITKDNFFKGFFSTIRGLYDTHIYSIAVTEEELLKKTHSCNYNKPWCSRCPKCCFSYLMLASYKGEAFAMEVVGSNVSLFDIPENNIHFESLFNSSLVAWECVASHEECLLSLIRCEQRNINKNIILKFLNKAKSLSELLKKQYLTINLDQLPIKLRDVTLKRLSTVQAADNSSKYDRENSLFKTENRINDRATLTN